MAALIAATGVVLLAPAAMGLTYSAPYAHVQQKPYDWLKATSGCAKQKSTASTFDPSTGNASWKGKVSVGSCAGKLRKSLTDNVAEASGATEISIPVRPPVGSATPVAFNVTWNIDASGGIAGGATSACIDPLAAGTNGSYECLAVAISELVGNAWLVDLTNGSVAAASNYPIVSGVASEFLNYTVCSPNCTSFAFGFSSGSAFSGPQTDTFTINATMNHADKYAIVTYVGGMSAVELDGYTGFASAFVDMGSPGMGAQLASIVET